MPVAPVEASLIMADHPATLMVMGVLIDPATCSVTWDRPVDFLATPAAGVVTDLLSGMVVSALIVCDIDVVPAMMGLGVASPAVNLIVQKTSRSSGSNSSSIGSRSGSDGGRSSSRYGSNRPGGNSCDNESSSGSGENSHDGLICSNNSGGDRIGSVGPSNRFHITGFADSSIGGGSFSSSCDDSPRGRSSCGSNSGSSFNIRSSSGSDSGSF